MSKELQTLILAYRVVFSGSDAAAFRESYMGCVRERLMQLAACHAVRPVLYQALRKAGIDDSLTQTLQLFASQMAMRDKLYGKEIAYLLKLLNGVGIAALPYKGYLFTEKLYRGQHFRESGDMDIVIREKDRAVEAIDLLCAKGYKLKVSCSSREAVANGPGREVSLIKESGTGLLFHLDFHWGVNEKYHVYPITTEDFFKEAIPQNFSGEEVLLPSGEAFFKMILNHHGGRGCWLKLKELFDFSLFLRNSGATEEDLRRWASGIRMDKVFRTGYHLNHMLEQGDLPEWNKAERKIIKFWERGKSYDRDLWLKIKKIGVYLNLQNSDISRFHLLKRYALYHGSNTPLYEKYYRPFGGRSKVLNFMAKMSTIFYRGVQGPYK